MFCKCKKKNLTSHGILRDCLLGSPSMPNPSQLDLNCKTVLVTLSVPGDISTECVDSFAKYVRKVTVHAYVVTERGESDRAHVHACLIFKDARPARKIQENVYARFVKPFHPDAIGRHAVQVQVMPGHKWYDENLQKECDKQVHVDTYDREQITDYFPSAAVQGSLQTIHSTSKTAAPHIMRDVIAWEATEFDNTALGALEYLRHRMFVVRDMVPLQTIASLPTRLICIGLIATGL